MLPEEEIVNWDFYRSRNDFFRGKKTKMANITVEGAELIFEIGSKVKEDFTYKKLPLMIAMINAILEDKKLDIKWENFHQ